MDNALGVDDNVNVVIVNTKQVVRLDHLQTLVHQGGGINGDLLAHAPVGVGDGLLDSHLHGTQAPQLKQHTANCKPMFACHVLNEKYFSAGHSPVMSIHLLTSQSTAAGSWPACC